MAGPGSNFSPEILAAIEEALEKLADATGVDLGQQFRKLERKMDPTDPDEPDAQGNETQPENEQEEMRRPQ
jgi:predicted DNA-binding transcriptional regulator YafY